MKKIGTLIALGVVLVLTFAAAPRANAQVVVGVGVGVGAPVYVRPVHYGYYVPRPYVAYVPAPAVVYPRVYVGPGPVFYRHWYPRNYYYHRGFDRRWR